MWQTCVWMHSHEAFPQLGSAVDYGWYKEGSLLGPVLFEGPTAADVIGNMICSCKGRGKCANDCTCAANGLGCTELCPCCVDDCHNPLSHKQDLTVDDNDDE